MWGRGISQKSHIHRKSIVKNLKSIVNPVSTPIISIARDNTAGAPPPPGAYATLGGGWGGVGVKGPGQAVPPWGGTHLQQTLVPDVTTFCTHGLGVQCTPPPQPIHF